MLRIGLTGGIASGKSTVCKRLEQRGFLVIDADRVAHHLICQGSPCFDLIIESFDQKILDETTGEISRKKLGDLVFNDPSRLQQLNSLVHPEVIRAILKELHKLERLNPMGKVVVDASLMIESEFHKHFKHLIVVSCRRNQQVNRLMRRSQLSEARARQRIGLQMSLEEKLPLATAVIDNSGRLKETYLQVDQLVEKLEKSLK